MEHFQTQPPEFTQLFFQYLRQADWTTRPWRHLEPGQELFSLIAQNKLPIYLGLLQPEHRSMQIGLWTHLCPMMAMVRPVDDAAMAASLETKEYELVPSHLVGATIAGRRRWCPGNNRQFAQLGNVMARHHSLEKWHRTDFVFAAEIDEHGKAAELWMIQQFEVPLEEIVPYPHFDFRTIANVPPHVPPHLYQTQLILELHCGRAGWRERSEAVQYVGLGLVSLEQELSPKPIHFIRVVQHLTGSFMHGTLVHPNRTGCKPVWYCLWCPENCTQMNYTRIT